MKKIALLVGIIVLFFGVATACSSREADSNAGADVDISVTLLGHDLAGAVYLETHMLENTDGENHAVTSIIDGHVFAAGTQETVIQDGAIVMIYELVPSSDAETVVTEQINEMEDEFFIALSAEYVIDPIWISDDGMVALVSAALRADNGESLVLFYLAQSIPGQDQVLSLSLAVSVDEVDEIDHAVLTEFGSHVGIDFVETVERLMWELSNSAQ